MYDAFSQDYDRFVNWEGRLAVEMPFLLSQLGAVATRPGQKLRVLDAACGTGMHAIALAGKGMEVAGADFSAGMVERARQNAEAAGRAVRFEQAGFGELAGAFLTGGAAPFDAVVCLGNSLPHVLDRDGVQAALQDFYACLAPAGLLLLQNRNFDQVMSSRERWMGPQVYRESGVLGRAAWSDEYVFLRFYDFDPDGLITFNVVTLKREANGSWQQQVRATRLRPLLEAELLAALEAAGFHDLQRFGTMTGEPFQAEKSENLVVVGRK